MADGDYNHLRRQFLGLGLTGAITGIAGCAEYLDRETSSEGNQSTSANIDTANFTFEYNAEAQQVTIECTESGGINGGDLQIRHESEREALWAELGSTTAGPNEEINTGATAVIGPDILNWETPIQYEETVRLIYVEKETPTTLEQFSVPELTDGTSESTDDQPRLDGFEDGNIEEYYGDIDGFEAQKSVVRNGEWSLKGQVQNGDNKEIYREIGFTQPNKVQGYVRVDRGGGNENAHITYFNNGESGSPVLHINFTMNEGSDYYGDESGDPQLEVNMEYIIDVEYSRWYFVELRNINWESETVGEVLVDGNVEETNINFQESASSIDTLRLKVNDWGNETGYFDDVSVSK